MCVVFLTAIKCSLCGTEQVVYVEALLDKPVALIARQTVKCVKENCNHGIEVTNTERIVDGPLELYRPPHTVQPTNGEEKGWVN